MFGLIILLCVLCAAGLLLNFLTLACSGRIIIDQRDSVDAMIDGHNQVALLVGDLSEKLDCLLTIDATAETSAGVNAV